MELSGPIRLDIGSGAASKPGWVSIDNRAHPAVNILWDLEMYPWPLEDGVAFQAFAGYVMSRISRAQFGFIRFLNEIHRCMHDHGELMIVTYYGMNMHYLADPAACNPVNEAVLYHFDPEHKSQLWQRYQPLPWQIRDLTWDCDGHIEALLAKRT